DVPENKIEVDVKRLGGGFGGKEDQATHWAVMAAVAARHTGRPVEIVLHREEDIRMTGKRHPYESDFKIGLGDDGLILAFEAKHFQNAGAFADLSMPVLERTLFHSTNAYFIPNVRVHAACCRTNLAPSTAFRGFGGPQGMFVIEAAIVKAADATGLDPDRIQAKNLLREGDEFYYGQKTERCMMRRTWDEAEKQFDLESFRKRVRNFNESNFGMKKGFAVMPVCFGISFTKSFLNQAGALVHVYTDGSVSVTSGGIEMGQGLSTNLRSIAARTFGIDPARVKVEATNTTRVSNMSPSAASATTDLNGNAVIQAVREIRGGLLRVAGELLGVKADALTIERDRVVRDGKPTDVDWNRLVGEAYMRRRKLSAYGYYATPNLTFDRATNKGNAFAYHVYGTCITEVSLDCLRGINTVDSVKVMHDLARPINELVDLGQIEGGLMQGLGWMTMEDLVWDEKGRFTSGSLSTYKAPDVYFAPDDLDVRFLPFWENEPGPLGAKAVGEPPLMYGIGVYFALQSAIRAFAPDTPLSFHTPMTPERALMALHSKPAGARAARS
ncbi:MAG: molybdopterin-dependent oxidoreductase, partial [Gemmatimonadetes bacterium]|nr:molybdopterin-dependent oxidoreductase [Gemmatimonadota bacterium]